MTSKVQVLLEALLDRGSIEDLGVVIDTIRDVYELQHVAYVAVSLGEQYAIASTSRSGPLARNVGFWTREARSLGAVTYPLEWTARYREAGYERIDPVVEGAAQSFVPINWKSLAWDTRKRQQFLREAVSCGIGNQGYTVPLHGPQGQFAFMALNATMNDESWDRFLLEFGQDFLVIAHYFHQKVLEIERIFGGPPAVALSNREKDVLSYIAAGKSRSQVAHDLKISENTLRVYLDTARAKLGALNVTHAVAIGVNRGLINI
jgi:DNA-binding CsgD family transcriptional regulator